MTSLNLDQLKEVPESAEVRKQLREAAFGLISGIEKKTPLSQKRLVDLGLQLLKENDVPEECLGFAMVMINNAFWLDQFLAVDVSNRLLLLPRCLADLGGVEQYARDLGYRIHVAEGSPIVVKIIGEESMDGIIGVGCLDSLDKAFSKVNALGIPSIAVPLNNCGCDNTEMDMEYFRWVLEHTSDSVSEETRTYMPLIRTAQQMFSETELDSLIGDFCPSGDQTDEIAIDWLRTGGKRLRPFITLASYCAAMNEEGTLHDRIKRTAIAIEMFHKASLVHDDIEDNDDTRYGKPTIHCAYGIPVAVNVGDYLLGLGYKLICEAAADCSPEMTSSLLDIFSNAHVRLSLGQGAELLWDHSEVISLDTALNNSIRKTSPAFEAAVASGFALAGKYVEYKTFTADFAKYLGIAFQIKNDLTDWEDDCVNARPTVLQALAFEQCTDSEQELLLKGPTSQEAGAIYKRCNVIERGELLKERFLNRAEQVAGEAPDNLPDFFRFLIEIILK